MNGETNKPVDALKRATKNRQEKLKIRVLEAIRAMIDSDIPINFQSVAREADVSKTWLYHHPELSAQIKQIRENSIGSKRLSCKRSNNEVAAMKAKIGKLESQVKTLKRQLEISYAEIFKLKNKI